MHDPANDGRRKFPLRGSNAVAIGAGVGLILGAALGDPGVGMVLGAAVGVVAPRVVDGIAS